jgi:serine/threonine protein phosphatase PrpC
MPGTSSILAIHFATALASPREASDDRLLVEEVPAGLLVVVADGAGGLPGSARAAELFIARVRDGVSAAFETTSGRAWADLLRTADQMIAADHAAGETTAVALLARTDLIVGASVGDSAAWIIRDDEPDVLTAHQDVRRVGSGRAKPVAFWRPFLDGTLVVGTDGLFAYTTKAAIAEVVLDAELDDLPRRLV